jgi:hypothetical protein
MGFLRLIFPNRKAPSKWVVRKTPWPFLKGYEIVNERLGVMLDTGLTKKAAKDEAARLNSISKLAYKLSNDVRR